MSFFGGYGFTGNFLDPSARGTLYFSFIDPGPGGFEFPVDALRAVWQIPPARGWPKLCSAGVIGYVGPTFKLPWHTELEAVLLGELDSHTGLTTGVLGAAGVGPVFGGRERMYSWQKRSWGPWETLALAGGETMRGRDYGAFAQLTAEGGISVGGFGGAEWFGGGGYVTATSGACGS